MEPLMEIDSYNSEVERFERFQTLQAGQYWKAKDAVPEEGIDKGEVLLLQQIRWVDDAMHTVILRAHPSKFGQRVKIVLSKDGERETWTWGSREEHRFLLDRFLELFEFEPDAQRIRAEEMAAVQAEIVAQQAELIRFQTDPAMSGRIVDEGLRAQEEKTAGGKSNLPALAPDASQRAAEAATGSLSTALSGGVSEQKIEMMKSAVNREFQVATVKANWIKGQTEKINETLKRVTPFMAEQAAAALASVEDVRSYAAKLEQGIATLDLYIGKDVRIDRVREGVSAPSDVPLTFVQRKLAVDEELAVYLDIDGWFDFTKDELFFEALRAHDGLVDQIFPTKRCVVVMATTRRYIDYGDSWTSAAKNEINHEVFLMVRDGENIHRVISPVTSHLKTDKLFPSKEDGNLPFKGVDGRDIKFDDVVFTDKLSVHERMALHFKRFLILACGLDHNHKLFGDFYEGEASFDFVTQEFQDAHCAFIYDDDPSKMIEGGSKRPSLREFAAEKNAYLRPGSRVICHWSYVLDGKTAPSACIETTNRGWIVNYHPDNADDIVVVRREGDGLFVDIRVHGQTARWKERSFNCKVNLSRYKPYDDIGFLCLDKVTPEELDWHINSRTSRASYLVYIRMFKAAKRLLLEERASEAETRFRLREALVQGGVAEGGRADAVVEEAVMAWRAANNGAALPTFAGDKPPAQWRGLLDQMFHLARNDGQAAEAAAAFAKSVGLESLRVAVTGDGKTVVYAAPKPEEIDDRLEPHAWVHRIVVGSVKGKAVEKSRKWALIESSVAAETELKTFDAADAWIDRKSVFPSFEKKRETLDSIEGARKRLADFIAPPNVARYDQLIAQFAAVHSALLAKSKRFVRPDLSLVVGATIENGKLCFVVVNARRAHAVLADAAPDPAARDRLREAFLKTYVPYRALDIGKGHWSSDNAAKLVWALRSVEERFKNVEGPFVDERFTHGRLIAASNDVDPTFNQKIASFVGKRGYPAWFSSDLLGEDGLLDLDSVLGLALPEGYGPFISTAYTLTGNGKNTKPEGLPGAEWIDVRREEDDDLKFTWADLPEKTREGWGMHSHSSRIATMAEAEASVPTGFVRAETIPGAPLPREGVARWYKIGD